MTSAPPRKATPAGPKVSELRTDRFDPRSPMARASDLLPFRPYVRRGDEEPPEVTAARERHRQLERDRAERQQEESR